MLRPATGGSSPGALVPASWPAITSTRTVRPQPGTIIMGGQVMAYDGDDTARRNAITPTVDHDRARHSDLGGPGGEDFQMRDPDRAVLVLGGGHAVALPGEPGGRMTNGDVLIDGGYTVN